MSKCKSNVRMQSLPLGWSRYPWRQAQRTPSALLWQWCAQPISSSHRELAVSSTTDRLHRANTRLCLHLQHMRQNCFFFQKQTITTHCKPLQPTPKHILARDTIALSN